MSRRFAKQRSGGDAIAQNNLGVNYEEGTGVEKDEQQAVVWYRKAAEQGNVYAQYNLGVMYANGHGVTQDYAAAVAWYRYAADNGHAGAKYFLKAICVQHATTTGCPYDWPGLRPR